MRFDRLLATALIIICLTAAAGNWLIGSSFNGSQKSKSTADIALLDVYGSISDAANASPLGGSDGANANTLLDGIRKARKDNVKAILLRINSPGGTAAAAQSVYTELMRVRKETNIKVIASLGDLTASGGYYIASAAHHIVANPSTLTGSIGVIMHTQNFSPLLEKVGVQSGTIQSGRFKDILSPYRNTTDDERKLLQGIVSESYEQFLAAIVAGRNISLTELRPLADGRIFTGTQAKKFKLVDSLGNYQDAIQKTTELAHLKKEPRIRNYTQTGLSGSLLGKLLPFSGLPTPPLPNHSNEIMAQNWNKVPLALME